MVHFIHKWDEWKEVSGTCKMIRTCEKCSKTEEKDIAHLYSEWEMLSGQCARNRVCQRCGGVEREPVPHSFGAWNYEREDDCAQVRRCTNCGYEERRCHHGSIGKEMYACQDSCTTIRRCARCGEVIIHFQKHQFTDWSFDEGLSCVQTRHCKRCGAEEHCPEKHDWKYADAEEDVEAPDGNSPLYCDCLEESIKWFSAQIEKCDQFLETIQDEERRMLYIKRSYYLKLKKAEHELRLKKANPDTLGDICKQCGRVINWGVTRKEMAARIYE